MVGRDVLVFEHFFAGCLPCARARARAALLAVADAYMRRYLRKGVPSLGTDLSSVFERQGAPPSVAAGGAADGGEEKLGRPSPVVTDAFDLRNHPVQQMVMDLTKR